MLKKVLVAPVAVTEVVIGVIAEPTVPFVEAVERSNSVGVIKVVADEVSDPVPAEFVATAETRYSVPGVKPVTCIEEPIAELSDEAVPIVPDEIGEIVTV